MWTVRARIFFAIYYACAPVTVLDREVTSTCGWGGPCNADAGSRSSRCRSAKLLHTSFKHHTLPRGQIQSLNNSNWLGDTNKVDVWANSAEIPELDCHVNSEFRSSCHGAIDTITMGLSDFIKKASTVVEREVEHGVDKLRTKLEGWVPSKHPLILGLWQQTVIVTGNLLLDGL